MAEKVYRKPVVKRIPMKILTSLPSLLTKLMTWNKYGACKVKKICIIFLDTKCITYQMDPHGSQTTGKVRGRSQK